MKKVTVFTVVMSMLFLGVPAPTDAGVLAGVATEWTQILNHVQLIMGYIRQGLQLENELRQYAEQLKQGRVLPQQLFGPIQQDLSQLSQVVQGGQALAYSMGNLDAQFRNTFPGYSFRSQGYFNDYKKWSQTSLDTTMNSLRAAGLAVFTNLSNTSAPVPFSGILLLACTIIFLKPASRPLSV